MDSAILVADLERGYEPGKEDKEMSEHVLLGDEALALGAIHAGISVAYAYPGTPSTEITEYIMEYSKREGAPKALWCSNEKTALEEGLGVSLVGKRALVSMKHVGLNVAADPFMNAALLDIKGGLVLAVADDPGMHSSQNEQDSRYYADFGRVPCLEPRNQQEAYDMVMRAFEVSEQFHIPVMVRLVTRLAHSRAVVRAVETPREENPLEKAEEPKGWMLLPAYARKQNNKLIALQKKIFDWSAHCGFNDLKPNEEFREFGVITTGVARNYYEENLKDLPVKPSHLHIASYPVPPGIITSFASGLKRIVILEEGYPFVEGYLRGLLPQNLEIHGKKNGKVPASGELNPDNIRPALGLSSLEGLKKLPEMELPPRPPQLCRGCPHVDSFQLLNEALASYEKSIVTSDIGCYALGALPPYQSIETIVCMGASVSMAKGSAEAGFSPVVAVIGDSTFLHSGITPLIDAVTSKAAMTLLILDNSTVAMTGGQTTMLPTAKIKEVVRGTGVEEAHIREIEPLKKNWDENLKAMKEEIEYSGVSVIMSVRECIESAKKRKKRESQEAEA